MVARVVGGRILRRLMNRSRGSSGAKRVEGILSQSLRPFSVEMAGALRMENVILPPLPPLGRLTGPFLELEEEEEEEDEPR